jgi:Tol biopolymer transport system component
MPMKWTVRLAAGALWWLAAATLLMAEDERRGRLLYTSIRPAALDVYLFEPGSAAKALTDGPGHNYDAAFSPDGRWVVFSSEQSGNPHLYVLDLEHPGAARQLTRGRHMDAAPAFTPDGKTLLFVSDRDGNADVFSMPFLPDSASGVQAKNLTHDTGGDFRPAVSPDGKTVAFSSDRDNERSFPFRAEIYAMDLNGLSPRRLTTLGAMSGSPAWSRDGRTLYFYSGSGRTFRIWAMNSDGTSQRPLTPQSRSALSPAVMPTARVAFVSTADGFAIMSVAADGTDPRSETEAQQACRTLAFDQRGRMLCTGRGSREGEALEPDGGLALGTHDEIRLPDRILDLQGVHGRFCSISPDGSEFVESESRKSDDSNATHLVVRRFDGSAIRDVFAPSKGMPVWATSWARRADLIAFTVGPQFASDDDIVDIWTVHSDGSNPKNLTQGKYRNNAFPDLTADGRQLVFRSTRNGDKDLYLMNSDGTNVRQVTKDPETDTMPTISPNGDLIAYSGNEFELFLQPLKDGRPDGRRRLLLQEDGPIVHSRFSPDAKWIAFASMRAWLNDEAPLSTDNFQPYGEVFVAPVDGKSEPIRVTHNRWQDSVPCWGVIPGK